MIQSIRPKGLSRFRATGRTAGIQPSHVKKLRMKLAALETAVTIEDMDPPGFRPIRVSSSVMSISMPCN